MFIRKLLKNISILNHKVIPKFLNILFHNIIIMATNILFIGYILLGMFFFLFNKQIGTWVYKLVLLFTDKLLLTNFFLFRINDSNRNSFYFLTRAFSVLFGLALISAAFYILY